MAQAINKELLDIAVEENYKVVYERRGAKGIISWWSKIREEAIGKDLMIGTAEKYDRIYLNGRELIFKK